MSLGDHTYETLHRDIFLIKQTHHYRAIKKLHKELNGQGSLTWNQIVAEGKIS